MKIHFNPPPSNPEESLGLSVRYAPAKRTLSKWRWRLVILLLIWPFLFYLGKYFYGTIWANIPGYVETDEIVLKTPVRGRVVHALDVGTRVKKGEVVAQLENGRLSAEYAALLTKSTESRKRGLAEALTLARRLRDYRRERYRIMLKLVSERAATEVDVANSLAALQVAERDVLNVKADMEAERAGKDVAGKSEARSRLSELRWEIDSLKIGAPSSGIVVQLYGKPGEWIPEGGAVASIRSENPPFIQAYVEPAMAKYATVGHLATIVFLDGGRARARVTGVGLAARRMPSDAYSPLLAKGESIVVMLETDSPLPDRYRIKGLPVNIRFDLF